MSVDITKLDLRKHIVATSVKDVSLLANPLYEKLQIKHFSFKRLYTNNEFIFLTTHPEMFINMPKRSLKILGARERHANMNLLTVGLLDYTPLQIAKNEFNLDNGLILVRNYNGYCEFIYFLSNLENYSINNFYLNNIDYFERFVAYFKNKTMELIREYEKNKLLYPKCYEDYIIDYPSSYKDSDIGFSIPHAIANIERNIEGCKKALTSREKQCIKHLSQGMTYKMIALCMNISYRTVEKHFENIRRKLHATSHSELVVKSIPFL